jgi:hypothetical protein
MNTRSLVSLAALGLLTAACGRSIDEPPAPRITNVRLSPNPAVAGQPVSVVFEAEGADYAFLEVDLQERPHVGGCLEFVSGTGTRSCDPLWMTVLGYASGSSVGGTVSIPYLVRESTTATIQVRLTDEISGRSAVQTVTVPIAR